jgi:hypothetical protein
VANEYTPVKRLVAKVDVEPLADSTVYEFMIYLHAWCCDHVAHLLFNFKIFYFLPLTEMPQSSIMVASKTAKLRRTLYTSVFAKKPHTARSFVQLHSYNLTVAPTTAPTS